MGLYALLDQVVALLRPRQRVTYRALQAHYHLADETLAALTDELLYTHSEVHDDAGRGLVWSGDTTAPAAHADLPVYRILGASGVQNRLDTVAPTHWTPLVGRDEEVTLLHRCWELATTGLGQVVLLSGEAGIGKSRLVQVLKDHVTQEPHSRIEWRGSPYHQHSALYPVIDQ